MQKAENNQLVGDTKASTERQFKELAGRLLCFGGYVDARFSQKVSRARFLVYASPFEPPPCYTSAFLQSRCFPVKTRCPIHPSFHAVGSENAIDA